MSKIQVGDKAPSVCLPASNGETIDLASFHGNKNVVLYFYPKDDTPGCTVQACGFRDALPVIEHKDAVVLGVSPDSVKKHEKFIAKFELPFLLLSDEDKSVCEAFGVWVEKKNYGRTYMGVARTTFIIDQKGNIAHIFDKVKPKDHAAEVESILDGMN